MIRVILNIRIIYPYRDSFTTLLDFCNLWNCNIIQGGSRNKKAKINMPAIKFKKIFGTNPKIGEYDVPAGAGHFIESIKVEKIITE